MDKYQHKLDYLYQQMNQDKCLHIIQLNYLHNDYLDNHQVFHRILFNDFHIYHLDNISDNIFNVSIDFMNMFVHIIEHYHQHNTKQDITLPKHIWVQFELDLHNKLIHLLNLLHFLMYIILDIFIHMHHILHQKMFYQDMNQHIYLLYDLS